MSARGRSITYRAEVEGPTPAGWHPPLVTRRMREHGIALRAALRNAKTWAKGDSELERQFCEALDGAPLDWLDWLASPRAMLDFFVLGAGRYARSGSIARWDP